MTTKPYPLPIAFPSVTAWIARATVATLPALSPAMARAACALPLVADPQFDSWLMVGLTDGDSSGVLGIIGADFDAWTESAGLEVSDGAVFWMAPDDGPSGTVTVAQLTTAAGTTWTAVMNAQGRSTDGDDWQARSIAFTNG